MTHMVWLSFGRRTTFVGILSVMCPIAWYLLFSGDVLPGSGFLMNAQNFVTKGLQELKTEYENTFAEYGTLHRRFGIFNIERRIVTQSIFLVFIEWIRSDPGFLGFCTSPRSFFRFIRRNKSTVLVEGILLFYRQVTLGPGKIYII